MISKNAHLHAGLNHAHQVQGSTSISVMTIMEFHSVSVEIQKILLTNQHPYETS